MKSKLLNLLLIAALLIGLALLAYPSVSDYVNNLHQSKAITEYADRVSDIDAEEYERIMESARSYNAALTKKPNQYLMTEEDLEQYEKELDISGNGVMGYIDIPVIGCSLSICHGTSDGVLQTSVGHIDWSSLPIGGESTHTVLSGHRGLPSAKIFSNLDVLREGDLFMLRVLDETLTYEVDQILIVEPDEAEALKIVEGMDYCTLVTCTPYGVNSHRLLVRGHRVENQPDSQSIRVTGEAIQIDPIIVAPLLAAPFLLVLFLLVYLWPERRKFIGAILKIKEKVFSRNKNSSQNR